jgi:hypothetical protein
MQFVSRLFPVVFFALLAVSGSAPARAASFVDRGIVLPNGGFELQLGLGLGHDSRPANDATGLGLNLELAYGLTSQVQFGFRTGIRMGSEGQATRADEFGRPFETETFGTAWDQIANPELSFRFALLRGAASLALDTRLYLPVEDGSSLGIMIGLPVMLRIGGSARLDSGFFVPVIFSDETDTWVSIPLHLWFEVDRGFMLGPITGVRFHNGDTQVPLGFGLGFSLAPAVELRTWLLFPDVSEEGSAKNFGVGAGFSFLF